MPALTLETPHAPPEVMIRVFLPISALRMHLSITPYVKSRGMLHLSAMSLALLPIAPL